MIFFKQQKCFVKRTVMRFVKFVAGFGLLLCYLLLDKASAEGCNKYNCPGPLKYYEELKCKPIFKDPEDCCASSYDCSHLDSQKNDKCYVNGVEYEIGEMLRKEDARPCDINCICSDQFGGAGFSCAQVNCPGGYKWQKGCYKDFSTGCCSQFVCPSSENITICDVAGKTFKEGEYFKDPSDPGTNCQCLPGYEGNYVEPFCRRTNCGTELRSVEIQSNCVPVYYHDMSPALHCALASKCPMDNPENDYIVHGPNKDDIASEALPDSHCKFGKMMLHVGDELKTNGEDFNSKCLRCKCDVPPFLTCRYLSHIECDFKPPNYN